MPCLQASQLGYRFNDGDWLFEQLTFSLQQPRTALVGRNGAGKSVLAELLAGLRLPGTGQLNIQTQVELFRQLPGQHDYQQTLAEYLGLATQLQALEHIEAGSCDSYWFEQLQDRWQLRQQLQQQLKLLGLPQDPYFPCAQLSGGQLARLGLWRSFDRRAGLLILDEPSNHLDHPGRQWLQQQILSYRGHILLISHDVALLGLAQEFWQLDCRGLTRFRGSYESFSEQQHQQQQALQRQLEDNRKQQHQLAIQRQKNREKAQQRAAAGNQLRRCGSQPKVLLDGKKNRAENAGQHRRKQQQAQQQRLQQQQQHLRQQQPETHPQSVKGSPVLLPANGNRAGLQLIITDGQLAPAATQTINLTLKQHSRLLLQGDNGSGKSTLLRIIAGRQSLASGELRCNSPVYYLDQQLHMFASPLPALQLLQHYCPQLSPTTGHTLLATIGLTGHQAQTAVMQLSGGEKVKLAMLIAAQQPHSPLLLLDEPDNHLDLFSRQQLAAALRHYPGAFILVSHDKTIIDECDINQIFCLTTYNQYGH